MSRPVLPLPALQRGTATPIAAQLAAHLRGVILRGEVGPGVRLASSRALADALGIARATVTTAYEQLAAEGYVASRRGAGVHVAHGLATVPALRPRGERSRLAAPAAAPPVPFATGAMDASLFPRLAWSRALARAWRHPHPLLGRADPFGFAPLREAIAGHLAAWRGLGVGPERIVVTSGAVESIMLLSRVLLGLGDRVAVEDPGYLPIRWALRDAGVAVVPVRIDAQGLDPARLRRPAALRAVLVTPSRQFPMGPAMPVARRLALLAWAERAGALVIEDDFDSEYRYRGAPLPALAALEGGGRTVYLGSFSKVLSGVLRIGWMVLPPSSVAPMRAALARSGTHASLVPQPALAELITSGRLARHIRRTRRIFALRQAALLAAAARHFDGLLEVGAEASGMHLAARLAPALARRMDDIEASRRAEAHGLTAAPLSAHASLGAPPQGLLLGFAGFAPAVLEDAARRLAAALSAP